MAIEDHTTIEDAYDAAARGLVKKSSEGDRQVEFYGLEELLKAKQQEAANSAASQPHFGLRFSKIVPPGCG